MQPHANRKRLSLAAPRLCPTATVSSENKWCLQLYHTLHLNLLRIGEVLEEQIQKMLGIMREIAIFMTDEGEPLGDGSVSAVERKNIDVTWDLATLVDQAHLGNKTSSQPLKASGGADLCICASKEGNGGDPSLIKTSLYLTPHTVGQQAKG